MEYKQEDFLQLSGIQHYIFCKRQWALIHVENFWAENYHTIVGNIMHENAHNYEKYESRKDCIIRRGMYVFSNSMGVSGECDVVEFKKGKTGINLFNKDGAWQPYPIEYKKGKSKLDDSDKSQLCAQAMCLEEMLCCNISKGAIFYGETKRREEVCFDDSLREFVKVSFEEMHQLMEKSHTPKVKVKKICQSCSLKEYCVPKLMKNKSVNTYISKNLEE